MQETQEIRVQFLGQEDPLEEDVATHSSILTWEIPRAEEPGRLQSMGLRRVGHDGAQQRAGYVDNQLGKQESSWPEHLTHELSTYKISAYLNIIPHLTSMSSTDLNISSQQPTGWVGCWQSDASIVRSI